MTEYRGFIALVPRNEQLPAWIEHCMMSVAVPTIKAFASDQAWGLCTFLELGVPPITYILRPHTSPEKGDLLAVVCFYHPKAVKPIEGFAGDCAHYMAEGVEFRPLAADVIPGVRLRQVLLSV